MDELILISHINDLLQEYGATKDITNVSYDGDNDSGSTVFDFNGKSFIISDKSIKELLM